MPIWGIWVDQRFYFSTGGKSRKAKNLARNRKCVVCTEKAHEAVIVEGIAAPVKDKKLIARVAPYYHKKYKPWKLDPKMGPIFESPPTSRIRNVRKEIRRNGNEVGSGRAKPVVLLVPQTLHRIQLRRACGWNRSKNYSYQRRYNDRNDCGEP